MKRGTGRERAGEAGEEIRFIALPVYYCLTKFNNDHPGTPRQCVLIFRRVVSAKHGLDLHRWHGGFLCQEQAELAQRKDMHVLVRGLNGIHHIEQGDAACARRVVLEACSA